LARLYANPLRARDRQEKLRNIAYCDISRLIIMIRVDDEEMNG
jgi:hypothetical protein